jgi:hypothetical protein
MWKFEHVLHLLCLLLMWLHPTTIKWKPRNMTWWCICEIMQGICFEKYVMNMYGSWDIKNSSYICFQVDLVLLENFQSMTLVILTTYAPHHSNKNHIGKYIKVIKCSFDAKSKYEHNGSLHVHWMLRLWKFLLFMLILCSWSVIPL